MVCWEVVTAEVELSLTCPAAAVPVIGGSPALGSRQEMMPPKPRGGTGEFTGGRDAAGCTMGEGGCGQGPERTP